MDAGVYLAAVLAAVGGLPGVVPRLEHLPDGLLPRHAGNDDLEQLPGGPPDRLLGGPAEHPLGHRVPVGDGEPPVHGADRVMDAGQQVGLEGELPLGLLGRGGVDEGTDNADDPATGPLPVLDGLPAHGHPAPAPVGPNEAVFGMVEAGPARLQGTAHLLSDPLPVLRVDAGEDLLVGQRAVVLEAEDLAAALVEVRHGGGHLVLPDPELGDLHRRRHPLLARLQRLLAPHAPLDLRQEPGVGRRHLPHPLLFPPEEPRVIGEQARQHRAQAAHQHEAAQVVPHVVAPDPDEGGQDDKGERDLGEGGTAQQGIGEAQVLPGRKHGAQREEQQQGPADGQQQGVQVPRRVDQRRQGLLEDHHQQHGRAAGGRQPGRQRQEGTRLPPAAASRRFAQGGGQQHAGQAAQPEQRQPAGGTGKGGDEAPTRRQQTRPGEDEERRVDGEGGEACSYAEGGLVEQHPRAVQG